MQAINCSEEYANQIIKNYEEGFKGTAEFAKRGSKAVRKNGYVLISPITGNKMYWWDFEDWKAEEEAFKQPGFWDKYREAKANNSDPMLVQRVKTHFKAASKYDRMARNSPCQGTAACILKFSIPRIFNWIVDNGYFGKVLLTCLVHDESCWEYPKELSEFPDIVRENMEYGASKFCKKLPIPAKPAVGMCWIH